jgi:hypothetical protein
MEAKQAVQIFKDVRVQLRLHSLLAELLLQNVSVIDLFYNALITRDLVACNLPQDKGSVGQGGYQLSWFYDTAEARCSQFWYGGMDGNANRFHSKEVISIPNFLIHHI